ncbi:uncharacterized protein LOC116262245 isoform X2 [Nymphaea colorata]|uniref:uncharacterized protein LOC116262245 isoform X2 n=1 Tax=Nymphaea colorata TaxID=210225 RepID=UPI00214E3399|nr:uncharacterized protein LOC116262245 isoform X2 [Nymphaea colorata]XP_049936072.1 uncharacterized protein LOC116262245 isoform X2 [Nymphaea colorata]
MLGSFSIQSFSLHQQRRECLHVVPHSAPSLPQQQRSAISTAFVKMIFLSLSRRCSLSSVLEKLFPPFADKERSTSTPPPLSLSLEEFSELKRTLIVEVERLKLVAISRALNGIGLAIVTPAIQSLVADLTDESNRGTAFGWLQLTGNLGSILGGFLSVLIASTTIMGIPGWRVSFHLVALVSVIVGLLVRLFASDPRYSSVSSSGNATPRHSSTWLEVKALIQEAKRVIRIPSFQIIVAQGVTGSFPWSALSFAPMWLELMGFSHQDTALLMGIFVIASSLGGLFGGSMGDLLAKRLPNSGRIILSQISSGSAIPLAAILLLVLPDDPSSGFMHGLVLFVMGLCISWNAPATNNPIFAEIVPEKSRTSIYALDRSFESILSSFAPPVVGILAERVYGYRPVPEGSNSKAAVETDRENAASLAKALYAAIGAPMTLCCLIYSFLYCTYPRDRDRSQMESFIESELQQLELDNSQGGELSEICITEYDETTRKESKASRFVYDEVENFEDDNDEKGLLAAVRTV